jgi:galactose-1-phosphate uridylyltransferase
MYAGLLNKGFTLLEAENSLSSYSHTFYLYPKLFISCLHDKSKQQINAMNQKALENILIEYGIDGELGQILMMMFVNNIMNYEEATNYFGTFGDYMKKVSILWDKHLVSMFALSNIGRVVAIAAYNNLFNASLSYSAWIPD